MKNLDEHAQWVWQEKSPPKKLELIREMIEYSDAKPDTKTLYLKKLPFVKAYKLDTFASNYRLAGEGLKVV